MNVSEQIQACKELKRELKLTNQEVSTGSGVPLGTVNRFFGNKPVDYRYDSTIKPIYDYLTNIKEPMLTHQEIMLHNELDFVRLLLEEKNARIEKAEKLIQTLKNIIVSFILLTLIMLSVILSLIKISVTYNIVIGICIIVVIVAWLLSLGVKKCIVENVKK